MKRRKAGFLSSSFTKVTAIAHAASMLRSRQCDQPRFIRDCASVRPWVSSPHSRFASAWRPMSDSIRARPRR